MENRKGAIFSAPCRLRLFPIFHFPFSIFLFLSACGTPGEPVPPRAPVAPPIRDLSARQVGDAVRLTFTLPDRTMDGQLFDRPPDIEVFRGVAPSVDASPAGDWKVALLLTIPSALVDTYRTQGQVQFDDPLVPAELAATGGQRRMYAVKTRASKRRASDFSNAVSVRVYPVARPIAAIRVRVTESAIELEWDAPAQSTGAASLAALEGALAGYRVYRIEAAAEEAAAAPRLLGPSATTSFRDTDFEFGRTYRYTVRSVVQYQAESAESADSAPAEVTPRDLFPPAAPEDLVVVLVPGEEGRSAHLELSWSISPEPGVAGYHVYRSAQRDTRGERITAAILPVPAFRDTTVEPGKRYTYTVTAVDKAGNESPRSAPVSVTVNASRE